MSSWWTSTKEKNLFQISSQLILVPSESLIFIIKYHLEITPESYKVMVEGRFDYNNLSFLKARVQINAEV